MPPRVQVPSLVAGSSGENADELRDLIRILMKTVWHGGPARKLARATPRSRINLSITPGVPLAIGQVEGVQVVAEDRDRKRLARLRSMDETGTHEEACRALRQIHEAGKFSPDHILIRDGFARLSQPLDTEVYSDRRVPERPVRPPATRLLRSRGCTLQFFLTALFEAQCRTRPGRVAADNTRPLKQAADQASWVDLVGPDADTAPMVSRHRAINARDRRVRQVRQALLTLAANDVQLVEFIKSKPDAPPRYHGFRLLHEAGRVIGDRVPYTVPMPTEQNLFSLDARLFTNGWVNVLKDTELAFLCMVGDLQAREGYDAVPITGRIRIGYYGLGTDGYQAHHLLQRTGLLQIKRSKVRRPDGTFKAPDREAPYDLSGAPNSFCLVSDGFSQPALPAIIRALQRRWTLPPTPRRAD